MEIKRKRRGLNLAILVLLLLFLTGCGNSSKDYIGRYIELDTGWVDRYLEINEDSTASLYDPYDTLTGDWMEADDDKSIELKLTEIGTEIFYAEFFEEDNIDVIKVTGGYYSDDKTAYYIRVDSKTHDKLSNFNVQQVLDALSEGIKINEINTYIENTNNTAIAETEQNINNTAIAQSEQNMSNTVIDNDETNNVTTETNIDAEVTNSETTENTVINTILTINNYKDPEVKINGENFDGLIKKAQKQSEDVMTSYVARKYADNEKFKKMAYLGYYALSTKDESSSNPFHLYLVYKVYFDNDKANDLYYYWFCEFDHITSLGQNEYSIDLSNYNTPSNRYQTASGEYWIDGYDSLDSLFHNVVVSNLEKCDYDSDIHDIENEEIVSFNNGETFDELIKKAQKQSENVMASYVARTFLEGEIFNKMDYLGYYVLNAKNENLSNPIKLFLVYKPYVSDDDGDMSYYWYCKFDNITSIGENKYSIDLSDYYTTDNRYYTSAGNFYYNGYDSLDSLFHDAIAIDVADYDYDSDIHDVEGEKEVEDTSAEKED